MCCFQNRYKNNESNFIFNYKKNCSSRMENRAQKIPPHLLAIHYYSPGT